MVILHLSEFTKKGGHLAISGFAGLSLNDGLFGKVGGLILEGRGKCCGVAFLGFCGLCLEVVNANGLEAGNQQQAKNRGGKDLG